MQIGWQLSLAVQHDYSQEAGGPCGCNAMTTMTATQPVRGRWDTDPASSSSTASGLLGLVPLVLLFYATLLPPEVRLVFAGQNLYAPRLVAFALLPWLIYRIASGHFRYRHLDLLLIGGAVWMMVSFSVYYDIATGLRRAGGMAFDVVAPYLLARLCITDCASLRRFLVLIAPGIFLAGLSLAAEGLLGRHLVRPLATRIFGSLAYYQEGSAIGDSYLSVEYRLGLLRAYGPFSHPILAGLFMASMLPLFALSKLRGWPLYLGVTSGIFAIFAGSSAAYLLLILALVLVLFEQVQERITFVGWRMFLFGMTVVALGAHVASQNGLISVLTRFTLNPETAAWRVYIWENGSRSVEQNPYFGVGFSDYDQLAHTIESIDNYWLLLAVRHGLPTPVLLGLLVIVAVVLLCTVSTRICKSDQKLFKGLAISLTLLAILAFTVALIGSIMTWFYMLLGIALSLTWRTQGSDEAGIDRNGRG